MILSGNLAIVMCMRRSKKKIKKSRLDACWSCVRLKKEETKFMNSKLFVCLRLNLLVLVIHNQLTRTCWNLDIFFFSLRALGGFVCRHESTRT